MILVIVYFYKSRIRYEADTTLRIYVLGVFAMCTKCKFRDE